MKSLQSTPNTGVIPAATVLVASSDTSFRHRVKDVLEGLRWRVEQATGGAEALLYLHGNECAAMILDSWLPDLEVNELIAECRRRYPDTDLFTQDTSVLQLGPLKSSRRQELWYALRRAYEDGAPNGTGVGGPADLRAGLPHPGPQPGIHSQENQGHGELQTAAIQDSRTRLEVSMAAVPSHESTREPLDFSVKLPEIVGSSPAILELCRQIRLVAPKKTGVLIEGPTGTGKELVARALHRLSKRSRNPFIVLNCAAIPEALLEAELFGHTKGAFTGAMQSRSGRLEAAHGGTLFLDEIGEMPLMLQSKLLRFLEEGELQRIGENELLRVDVRVIAATHQFLEQRVSEGSFRADLYFRLAVFPLLTPSLAERREDIPELAAHFLRRLAADQPAKSLQAAALQRLTEHSWPGGVRELEHVLERGYILAEGRADITAEEIRFGSGRSAKIASIDS